MEYFRCLCIILLLAGYSSVKDLLDYIRVDTIQPVAINNNDMATSVSELYIPKNVKCHWGINKSFVYSEMRNKDSCFVVISKLHTCLSVYEIDGGDTLLLARYPVCLGKRKGNKDRRGDMKTPESSMNAPFKVIDIQNASGWYHDFGDGRGPILAYGRWFLRLETPGFSGIGIHGSTNNESSVPGRASEGCIRLRDTDIIHLKEHYAFVGMKVIIMPEDADWMRFEKQDIVLD